MSLRHHHVLEFTLSECKLKEQCDVYATISVLEETFKTQIIHSTNVWNFGFKMNIPQNLFVIKIQVFCKRLMTVLLGTFSLESSSMALNLNSESWLHSDALSIRIKYLYHNEMILPLPAYKSLVEWLTENHYEFILCLNKLNEKTHVFQILTKILVFLNVHESLLKQICVLEIQETQEPSILFRGNSMATKCLETYMKLSLMEILFETIRPVIHVIILDNKTCELDPLRNQSEDGKFWLFAYLDIILERIYSSADSFPLNLKNIFASIKNAAELKWPSSLNTHYISVTCFVFLRFFSAAILGPNLFHLSNNVNDTVSRTLTLLSKSLMQLANFCIFDGLKEPFMIFMNPLLVHHMPLMRLFIDKITNKSSNICCVPHNLYPNNYLKKVQKSISKFNEHVPDIQTTSIDILLNELLKILLKNIDSLKNVADSSCIDSLAIIIESLNSNLKAEFIQIDFGSSFNFLNFD